MQGATHPVSAILSGSWRAEPDPARVPEASLETALPVLTSTGASGLAWNRIKHDPRLARSTPGAELRQHARALVLDMARHEAALGDLLRLLKDARIEPLLFKGWAVAQHYAEPHLRPMGDVDLCAPPGRFDEAAALLRSHGFRELNAGANASHGRTLLLTAPVSSGRRLLVDLHERLDKLHLGPIVDVFARARTLPLGDEAVLVPAVEDHLRIVAMHFLRDGGWRPLSLCDVGAVLESLPHSFDWDLCLGADPRRRRWIACTFELARELLGARSDAVPDGLRVSNTPSWLSQTIVRAWDKPLSEHRPRIAFSFILRKCRSRIPAEALARWPNAIRASVELDAAFTALPRWPIQLIFFVRSVARFVLRRPEPGKPREPSSIARSNLP